MNLALGGQGGYIGTSKELLALGGKMTSSKIWKDLEFIERFSKRMSDVTTERWKDDEYRKIMLKKINWTGKTHTEETKKKMSESSKGNGKGSKNSQFGTCWITNGIESKKIYKGDLIPEGWSLGRKMKNKHP